MIANQHSYFAYASGCDLTSLSNSLGFRNSELSPWDDANLRTDSYVTKFNVSVLAIGPFETCWRATNHVASTAYLRACRRFLREISIVHKEHVVHSFPPISES
jgi:hypothetical protein